MIHTEVETVRNHHSNITPTNPHQTSPSLSQKTPFAIQELLGLTNTPSEHDSMNNSIKQLQNGEQNNPFSYYNSKAVTVEFNYFYSFKRRQALILNALKNLALLNLLTVFTEYDLYIKIYP